MRERHGQEYLMTKSKSVADILERELEPTIKE